eukprot:scpid89971/ scgid30789/ 
MYNNCTYMHAKHSTDSAYSLPLTLYCMFAHVCAYWTANVAHNMYELRSSLMWHYRLSCLIKCNNTSGNIQSNDREESMTCDVTCGAKRIFVRSLSQKRFGYWALIFVSPLDCVCVC